MRKQYHSRPSAKGLCVWDVDRLVSLTKNLPVKKVPLADIRELDEPFWFGEPTSTPTCRAIVEHAKLMAEVDLSYPIILSSDGRVMDGMHRVAKSLFDGLDFVYAVRFTEDPEPDFIGVDPNDLPYD